MRSFTRHGACCLVVGLFINLHLSAQNCNAAFTFVQASSNNFRFEALQEQTSAFTHYHTWIIGNGAVSNAPVLDRYLYAGNNAVGHVLRVEDVSGNVLCVDTEFQSVIVPPPCGATFKAELNHNASAYDFKSQLQQYAGLSYYHIWRIDGVTNPQHSGVLSSGFTTGTHQVCHSVEISDSIGNQFCADTQCVTIQWPPVCLKNVYYYANMVSPGTIRFSSNVYDFTNKLLTWNFGDTTAVSNDTAPTHQYNPAGSYRVCLTVWDTVEQCGADHCDYINSDCYMYPYFDFEVIDLTTKTFQFSHPSGAPSIKVEWDLDDGTLIADSNRFVHRFTQQGSYNVCLSLSDTITGCSSYWCEQVDVDTCINSTMAHFGANVTGNGEYWFVPDHSNARFKSIWRFGDGDSVNTNTLFSMQHRYPAPGTYTPKLSVDVPGCPAITDSLTVTTSCYTRVSFYSQEAGSNKIYFPTSPSLLAGKSIEMIWDFGDGSRGTAPHPVHIYTQPGTYYVCCKIIDTVFGCVDSVCRTVIVKDWTDTICGHVFIDYNLNSIQDGAEPSLSGGIVSITNWQSAVNLQLLTDSNGNYMATVPKGVLLQVRLKQEPTANLTLPVNAYMYTHTFYNDSAKQCGFDFGTLEALATITGNVFADVDGNGLKGGFEKGLANQLVQVGRQKVISRGVGDYRALVPAGNCEVKKDSSGLYKGYGMAPALRSLQISAGGLYTGNDFGVNIPASTSDVAIDLVPTSIVRWRFSASYCMIHYNLGPNATTITDTMGYTNGYTVDAAGSSYSSVNPNTRTIVFNDLLPGFETNSWPLLFNLSYTAPNFGDLVTQTSLATIVNGVDGHPANNDALVRQHVVAAYDPNEKLCQETGLGPQGFISNSQQLIYTINFQNLGTASAINVIVVDTIDSDLDVNTFRYIGAGKGGQWNPELADVMIDSNIIYFRYSNIELPDSATDEPGSHGFAVFAISPKPNLAPLTKITNSGAIYFDQNEPVITNTTLHTIEQPNAVKPVTEDGVLQIAPNPFEGITTITIKDLPSLKYTYTLTDITGRQVNGGHIYIDKPVYLHRNNLAAGTYILTIYNDEILVKRAKITAQ